MQDQIRENLTNQWVSVEERLPEPGQIVLQLGESVVDKYRGLGECTKVLTSIGLRESKAIHLIESNMSLMEVGELVSEKRGNNDSLVNINLQLPESPKE